MTSPVVWAPTAVNVNVWTTGVPTAGDDDDVVPGTVVVGGEESCSSS